ncbi:PH domain-containing protein [Gordonia sp. (in: high G+C Gram-positive bacteria)]|uniref:PH domain-containing protein n=1 Tax=Gordonia sp. (in: high G+C Gram-positive bacteria) TaxID=84139 RepID=UPI0039E5FE06
MGYPEQSLAPGESVVLHRHPHWKLMVGPLLVFAVVTLLAGVLGGIITGSTLTGGSRTAAFTVLAVFWGIALIWLALRPLVTWATTHFVVTDRRVMYRNGIVARSGIDIPIARINTVEFRHGLMDRIMRTGSLTIESAADEPLTFINIPDVERVHALLYEEVLEDHGDRYDDHRAFAGEDR